ncbi:MAG: hypothetical protein ABI999_14470 [Acidobacteriota bacterium]
MFVVHRGKGVLVLISGIVSALFMNIVTDRFFGDDYYSTHAWPKFAALWLIGSICFAGGLYLRKYPTKLKVDRPEFEGESTDHFFYIPVIYWGPIFFLLGIIYLIYSLMNHKQ